MPRTSGALQTSLSLSLLGAGLTPALAFKSLAALQHYPVKDGAKKIGDLYVAPVASDEPRWGRYVKPFVAGFPKLQNKSVSAVMLVNAGGRTFAVTFGYGWGLLGKDVTEDRFGPTVTLNAVGAGSIRTTSKKSLDAFAYHTHTQAIRAGRLPQFGVNLEQDLLQAVTGAPDDTSLGIRLARAAGIHDVVTRAISGHATPEMQQRYSTPRGDEVKHALSKVAKSATSGADIIDLASARARRRAS